MDFASVPASSYPLSDLVSLLNQGFEDYFIPIQFTNSAFVNMLHKDDIDLSISRILQADHEPCGIALIARRRAPGLPACCHGNCQDSTGQRGWLMANEGTHRRGERAR